MKIFILYLLRSFGFFTFSRFLIRKNFLIIAYHGVEINDESSFSPNLFIKRLTLERRMEYLKNEGFNVLGLDEALKKLDADILPKNSVVITVDDGWYSTMYHADRVFSKHAYPYTIYITSYYAKKKLPVLNVVLRYLLWSCSKHTIKLDLLAIPELSGMYFLSDTKEKNELQRKLFEYFNSLETVNQKTEFIKNISNLLGVDYKRIETERYLGLLSFSEIKDLSDQGVNIQLHTHKHTIPFNDREKFENEISENKYYLNSYVRNKLEHFCYPSGQHNPNCESVLKSMGILSATTCEPGFITKKTNPYYLPRFIDGENIAKIIFEAEVCGVSDLLRKIKSLVKPFLL